MSLYHVSNQGKGSKIKCYSGAKAGTGNNEVHTIEEKTCDEGVTQCTKSFGSVLSGKYVQLT